MNVAFLQATLGIGGAERLAQSILTRLDPARARGVAINLYSRGVIGDQLAAAGVPVESELAGGPWDPAAGARLMRVLAARDVDVLYVADSALPQFWAGAIRRLRSRPRLVLGFHSTLPLGSKFQRSLANASAFPVVDRFVALALSHREFLCKHYRLASHRFSVIPNGVDTARFAPAADRTVAKQDAGLDPALRYVGIVAALRPEKNHLLFLDMARRVAQRHPAVRFLVIGDGPERPVLEEHARRSGMDSSISFLGARHDVPELLRALDLCVLSSFPVVETFPLTLLEAQACGVPVVSTDVGSIRDVVADGETGRLVPSSDLAALASAVDRLIGDEALCAAMGAAARRHVTRSFALEATVGAYEALFSELAGA